MLVLHRLRHAAEYVVGTALVLVHLALSGRRLALVELLEPPREPRQPPDERARLSRASG